MNVLKSCRRAGIVTLSCLALFFAGCGGGGATGSSGSLSLSASKTTVAYGEPVTISWSASGDATIIAGQCNFPVSGQSGSIVDYPSYDTTYRIRGNDGNGADAEKTRTVVVQKSAKKILLIGDTAVSGTNQIKQYLQTITTQPVDTRLDITGVSPYDVVVLLPSAAYIPSDNAEIAIYLTDGGSVILVDQAPRRLATGNGGVGDVSAIGSWCAGVTSLSTSGFNERVITSNSGSIKVSAVLFGDDGPNGYDLGPVSALATRLTTNSSNKHSAFVYEPPSGGKVGFVGGLGIGTSEADSSARELLLTEARWMMDGG